MDKYDSEYIKERVDQFLGFIQRRGHAKRREIISEVRRRFPVLVQTVTDELDTQLETAPSASRRDTVNPQSASARTL